jgi:hypothetical protein
MSDGVATEIEGEILIRVTVLPPFILYLRF